MAGIEELTKPLTAEEIEWKIVSSRGGQTLIAPYITSRSVMERFDRAFGPFGWMVTYRPVNLGEGMTGFLACIAVRDPNTGDWVEKEDGAGPSDMEPLKGAVSGALKRAATVWGVGRELYAYPRIYITGEHKYIPHPVLERLKRLPEAVAAGKPLPEAIRLNPDGSTAR